MNSQEVIKSFEESKADLLQTLSAFDAQQFNTVPFEGSWTAGQLAEHLLKSATGIPEMLREMTKATERPVDALAGTLSGIFLDFNTKMTAPDFNTPSEGPHNREELLDALSAVYADIGATAGEIDLSLTCTSFPFPQVGELTGLEWIHFVTCHSLRHTRQAKNIYNHLSKATV